MELARLTAFVAIWHLCSFLTHLAHYCWASAFKSNVCFEQFFHAYHFVAVSINKYELINSKHVTFYA